ncbi:membrane protein [soil metagenome]
MGAVAFDPLLPLVLIGALAALSLVVVGLALWRGLGGWWLRLLAAAVVLAALINPSWRQEDRAGLSNIALVLVNETASSRIDGRGAQTAEALAAIEARLERLGETEGIERRVIRVPDRGDEGTRMLSALAEAAAELSPDRIAGAILITDGQVHDAEALESFPAPVHVLLTGSEDEWDRRVVVETAPAFAIVGEPVEITLRVEDAGTRPDGEAGLAELAISQGGGEAEAFTVPVGRPVTLPLTLATGGENVIEIATPVIEGELTGRNNAAIVTINGVRDRLRVLLVSGEPYAGERTWRNILKSDSAVDLVHFTILRPPDKQDFVPVFELSLIAFPTQELFMEKVDEFDLIIFDRYKRRGILPNLYFENIARYVREGGALLIAGGEDFAGADSIFRSPLRDVLPVEPTARVIEQGYHPVVSELGLRHPVTEGLDAHAPRPAGEDGTPGWGRWFRMAEVETVSGQTVMEGPDDAPLLVLDRVGEGRIALLASDQAWLWSRGYEGGGPQLELLRRLAHWMMGEPDLEEEALTAATGGGQVAVTRRTLAESVPPLRVESPAGEARELAMSEVAPGRWRAEFEGGENGVWRLASGDLAGVAVVGPAAPVEFEDPVSTGDVLRPLASATRGAVLRLEDGHPNLRVVREGRVASGRSWIGLADRDAYSLRDIRLVPLAPGWLMLLLATGFAVAAWRIEGR